MRSAAIGLLLVNTLLANAGAEPRLAWVEKAGRMVVEVSALDATALAAAKELSPAQWRAILPVAVQAENAPPMLGRWTVEADTLRFTPQFPLTAGVTYEARFQPTALPGAAAGTPVFIAAFTAPTPTPGPPAKVTQIFPSTAEIPQNLLKFYVHFSAPMSGGHIYEHIHLRDAAGRDIELPFLEIDEELWDPGMKRLTLFLDPGRIKRDVRPLEEIGPALTAGARFTLVIDAAWLDATGQPLAETHARVFHVGPPDRTPIDPTRWKLTSPASGTRAALHVQFPEPLDHALASRLLHITGADGTRITGQTALSEHEQAWSFTPDAPWTTGAYELVVSRLLEDLAGNNVGRAFEVDLRERGERLEFAGSVRVPFAVR